MERWHTTIWLASLAFVGTWITPWPTPVAPVTPAPAAVAVPTGPPPAPVRRPDGPHCPTDGSFLTFEVPVAPRRLPQRPAKCTEPPPGGTDQFVAIDAARRRECAQSLRAIQAGMEKSIDHCTLYRVAWLCFNEVDQRPLWEQSYADFDELGASMHHFDGTVGEQQATQATQPELAQIPAVYLPSADGLEARLDAFGTDPELRFMANDLFGAPTIADHLTEDLFLEGQVALALACVPPERRTPAMERAWARRVYAFASAMNGHVGTAVRRNRREAFEELGDLLGAVVGEHEVDGRLLVVPESVREAVEVARGDRPLPLLEPDP